MKSQLAFQAQAGDFLRHYRPPTNIHTLINSFVASRVAFYPSAQISTTVQFPDTSFYQKEIDFDVLKTKTQAVILRAGQNLWPDVQFQRSYFEAKRVGLLVGAYWFYDDRASPGAQADTFKLQLAGKMLELEAFIDWENTYGGQFRGLGNVVAMMQRLESFQLPIKDVGMYTGNYWFRANSNPIANAGQYVYLKNKPLWEAWYTDNPANVLIPPPWNRITHWQFGTPTVEWGQKTREIDMNYFNGTQQEFVERYGETYMATWTGRTKTEAKVWRDVGLVQIATIPDGTDITGDGEKTISGTKYLHITTSKYVGWTKAEWVTYEYQTLPPPPPPPANEYIMHVKDGIARKFVLSNE